MAVRNFSPEFLDAQKKKILTEINAYSNRGEIAEAIQEKDEDNPGQENPYVSYISLKQKSIPTLQEALESIRKGDYGICRNCGKEIEIMRLKAVPAAIKCIKCMR